MWCAGLFADGGSEVEIESNGRWRLGPRSPDFAVIGPTPEPRHLSTSYGARTSPSAKQMPSQIAPVDYCAFRQAGIRSSKLHRLVPNLLEHDDTIKLSLQDSRFAGSPRFPLAPPAQSDGPILTCATEFTNMPERGREQASKPSGGFALHGSLGLCHPPVWSLRV